MAEERIAVVTGANRGIGLETCRQLARLGLSVVLTSRDPDAGRAAVAGLAQEGLAATQHRLDVADARSIRELASWAERELGRVDVLVNNAAVYLDEDASVLDVPPETLRATLQTNVAGPLLLSQLLVPGMTRRRYGRVVNVSSGAGQLSTMRDYAPTYSISKAALNALTRLVADAAEGTNVLVNAVCPGWVRTRMGGSGAPRSVEQGAETVVWAATLPDGGPTGGFFRDRKLIPW